MEEVNQTIYKKDTKGKLRELTISTNRGKLSQESGLVGGSIQGTSSFCTPKNVGKSNESTSYDQAITEANAKLTDKLGRGYFLTKEEAEGSTVILPMLAKVFEKEQKKIDWTNCYVQPKLDGMRCLKKGGKMVSRTNKTIDTMSHIASIETTNQLILDGELYAHGLSFQENMKLIKKYRPGQSENVKYHVYDLISDKPFSERYAMLTTVVEVVQKIEGSNYLELVPTTKVTSFEEVKQAQELNLSLGYEGTIIRWGDEPYKIAGRSSNLLKYKDFLDDVATVVDVVPSERNPLHGVVHCKMADFPDTFGCGMKFSHAEREEILINKNKYIGRTAEIRFFEYTDSGLPRFPVCVGFRLDK